MISQDVTPDDSKKIPREPIAVIGIGCRLPGGVDGTESFWKLLVEGGDAITDVPSDRWNHDIFYHPEPGTPGKTVARQAGFVSNVDHFDHAFFGISPREAGQMDPQHRLVLEVSWEAIEDAGLTQERLSASSTGVFVGIASHDYAFLQSPDTLDTYASTGLAGCMAAHRVSYAFNLIGPSLIVDTACSSALVAVHMACHSIWDGESTMALAGGVNVLLDPTTFVSFSKLSMLSPDSRCQAFDARANGFVRSEGAGIVVLKPLSQARADGNSIYAVILGTGVNQDGHSQGITFPNQVSQEKLLQTVYAQTGVAPNRVRYIEGHGTGTQAGDPVEARSIGRVLGQGRPAGQELLLGSVKTNIGHLEAGAGAASLIKACLVLKHRLVPRNLHFEQPNPQIPLGELGLSIPVEAVPLKDDEPVVVGVNGFGFGGTNAHVIMTEAPEDIPEQPAPERSSVLLTLSAKSPEALEAVAESYQNFLDDLPDNGPPALADICYTAAVRRTHHPYRLAVMGHSAAELRQKLESFSAEENPVGVVTGRVTSGQQPRLAFVFSGQGPQWWAMGRELLANEPVFKAVVERCDQVIRELGGWSLLDELNKNEADSQMHVTAIVQPAIFAIQAGLTALWQSWGIMPEAVVGHSIGEIAAAYAAGVLELEDAARVAFHRGRAMERASSRGRMLAVGLSQPEVAAYLDGHKERVSIAAANSLTSLTLSGEAQALEEIAQTLERNNVFCKFLRVDYAFHSPQMEPIRADVLESLQDLAPRPASVGLVSTVTGTWLNGNQWNADYVWQNVRQTVRFADAVNVLVQEGYDTFIEISPHPVLSGYVQEILRHRSVTGTTIPSLRRNTDEVETLFNALSVLYTQGYPVDWQKIYPSGQMVTLPHYPWQRERCWSEGESVQRYRFLPLDHPLLGKKELSAHPLWANKLDTRLLTYLEHHQLQGASFLPASAYLEMVLAAGQNVKGSKIQEIEDVTFENPCFLPENKSVPLECRFSPAESQFEIFSRSKRDSIWTRHASARIVTPAGGEIAVMETPSDIVRRLPEPVPGDAIYALLSVANMEYGPSFRCIHQAWRTDGEALGEVVLPSELESDVEEYQVHPVLLDACFHVITVAVPRDSSSPRAGKSYLPVGVDRVRFYRRPGNRVYGHARLLEITTESLVADVQVLDENGELLIDLKNLRFRAVEGSSARTSPLDELLYRSEWQPRPRPESKAETLTAESWLIFADQGSLGAKLSQRIAALGHQILLVRPGDSFSADEYAYVVNPGQPEDMQRLLQTILEADLPPLTRIVNLWALDSTEAGDTTLETLENDELFGVTSLLHLVQALAEWPDLSPPRLWVVTLRAQAPRMEEQAHLSVAQSPLWGLRRVAAFEQFRLRPAIVDLGAPNSETEIDSLFSELSANLTEDEIILRGNERFVHRYTRTSIYQCTPPSLRPVAPDAQPFRLKTSRPGVLDNLALMACPAPEPAPGEVSVEVKAAGLNFSDVLKGLGLYPGTTAETLSFGAECAGVLTAFGEGSEEMGLSYGGAPLRIGDPVVTIAPHSFGSFVTTPVAYTFPIPQGLTFEQAATIPIAFITAQYALIHVGRLRRGERILIHSASGGVGLAAIQIAQNVGAEIYATAGNPEKREFLQSLGIEHVMDSRSLAFADQIMEATDGEGVDLVLNSLAGEAIAKGLSVLRPFGRFIEIGKRDVYANARLGLSPFRNNIAFTAVDLDQAIRTRPELVVELFREVLDGFDEGIFTPIPLRAFPITEVVDAFRHMSKAQHIGKVVISNDVAEVPVAFPYQKMVVRQDATYLITGGVGGFGRAIAQWLAERGAGHLVLISRSGPNSPLADEAIETLSAHGCQTHVWAADVADPDQIRQVLGRIESDLPPLRGIIHAAMVLDDGVITGLDQQRLQAVMHPKVLGAWNLHSQTLDLPLDFFVMTSSLASLNGSPGQANYAAANAFLDALAHYRHGLDLPALTLNLGALDTVGHVARHPDLMTYLEKMGVPTVSPGEVFAVLDQILGSDIAQLGVLRLDFKRLAELLDNYVPPLFAELLEDAGGVGSARSKDRQLRQTLERAAPEEREKLLLGALVQEMGRVMGVAPDRLDVGQALSDLGLDSLMAVELIHWVEDDLGLKLATVELMRNPTVAELAQLLSNNLAGKANGQVVSFAAVAPIDLRAEAKLDPAITPEGDAVPVSAANHLLLTGATGLLGSFLLRELLVQTGATVHCLVRAHDSEDKQQRFRAVLETRGLWEPEFENRIVIVRGDLSQPLLGLTPETFDDLAESIDAIYHAGAIVNFFEPYTAMRATNVQGTQEILRLACRTRAKQLHHISTIGVFSGIHYTGLIEEDMLPAETDGLPGGYSQSKWVAEQLVLEAMSRGLSARIYRPGLLMGHSQIGGVNLDDILLQLLRATCQIGLVPDLKWHVDVSPVDTVAHAVARISTHVDGDARAFHLCNPEPTSIEDLTTWMRALGVPLEVVPYPRWYEEMAARAAELGFEQTLSWLPENESEVQKWLGTGERRFSVENTRRALDGSSEVPHAIGRELFIRYVRHLEQEGLFGDLSMALPSEGQ